MTKKVLKFAPLIRVSTEKQEKRGESLQIQQKQLDTAVESLGGKVFRWYSGQEHATVDQERKILDQLMRDAQEKKFDAVMVCDVSRWSRDNKKSKEYINVLKKHGIRFFLGTKELDLYNPEESLILGMGVEIAEYFGRTQAYKSMQGKIAKAKKGFFSAGRLPYGRLFDKKTNKWSVDENKKKQVEEMARLYLGGMSYDDIAKKMGIGWGTCVQEILSKAGNSYTVHFNSSLNNIQEDVQISIPPLLSEPILKKIQEKSGNHRNWDRKTQKHPHLFSKIIFDAATGRTLTGCYIGREDWKYYRIARKPYGMDDVKKFYSIRADAIEGAVLSNLFEALGSSESLKKAVYEGHPTSKMISKLKSEKAEQEKALTMVKRSMDNYKKSIGEYAGDDVGGFLESIRPEIKKLDSRQKEIISKIQGVENQLKSLPTDEEIREKQVSINRELTAMGRRIRDIEKTYSKQAWKSGAVFHHLPFPIKRRLVSMIFGGRDDQGRRYGIYVRPLKDRGEFVFEAYGRLGSLEGSYGNQPLFSPNKLPPTLSVVF